MNKLRLDPPVLPRLLLLVVLVSMLGLSAGAVVTRQNLVLARRAQADGQPLQAASRYRAVLAMEPWRVELWLSVGRNAWAGGDALGAIEALTKPGLVKPLEAQDQLILGDAYLASGDVTRAEQAWQQALLAGAGQGQVTRRLLDLHIAQGNYAAQVEDLKTMLSLEPANAQINFRLGQILSTMDPAAAMAYLAQAQVLDPSLSGKAGRLQDVLRTAQLSSDPSFSYLQAGRVLAAEGDWALALESFLRATELNPGLADAWAYLGEANYQVFPGELSRSRQALDEALRLAPHSLAANAFMALYWQRQGNMQTALAYLQEAASQEAHNPLWQAAIGQAYAMLGDLPSAQVYYERAVSLAPGEAEYHRLLAEFFIRYQIQVSERAVPAARAALDLEPDDELNLDVMGQALLLSGDHQAALPFFQRAIELAPDYAPALLHLGVAYLDLGQNDLAYPLIEKAYSLEPGSATSEQAANLLEYFFR